MKPWLELCVPLVKESEGCRLRAYPDPASGGEPWTIGWGATGPDIGPDTVWTQDEADADLYRRLGDISHQVSRAVRVRLTPGQRAALVDFAYNIGLRSLLESTLLKLLNAGDYQGAADQFGRWIYARGNIMPGLVKRRAKERDLFLQGVNDE